MAREQDPKFHFDVNQSSPTPWPASNPSYRVHPKKI